MKQIIKEIVGFFLFQINRFLGAKNDHILSVYFHNPSRKVFKDVVSHLRINGFKIISLNDLEIRISKKSIDQKLAIITLDDGWLGNLELIDLVEKYEAPITIFVSIDSAISGNYWFEYASIQGQEKLTNVASVEEFKRLLPDEIADKVAILKNAYKLNRSCMSVADIQRLASNPLVGIGSHTVTHPILDRCSSEQKRVELADAKSTITNWISNSVKHFAYPNGDYDQNTIDIAKECGYTLAFTNVPGKIDVHSVNPYLIPRNGIEDDGGYYENISKATGVWQRFLPKKVHKMKRLENNKLISL